MRTTWIYVGPREAWEARGSPGRWVDSSSPGSILWVAPHGGQVEIVVLGEEPWSPGEPLRRAMRARQISLGVSRG